MAWKRVCLISCTAAGSRPILPAPTAADAGQVQARVAAEGCQANIRCGDD